MPRIEDATASYDEALDTTTGAWTSPFVSGDPQSLVSWASLGREGRRHVTTFVRPQPLASRPVDKDGREAPDLSISTVMDEEVVAHPIAV
jgi:hypothetical protein